jgi:hypothetical protein
VDGLLRGHPDLGRVGLECTDLVPFARDPRREPACRYREAP